MMDELAKHHQGVNYARYIVNHKAGKLINTDHSDWKERTSHPPGNHVITSQFWGNHMIVLPRTTDFRASVFERQLMLCIPLYLNCLFSRAWLRSVIHFSLCLVTSSLKPKDMTQQWWASGFYPILHQKLKPLVYIFSGLFIYLF